MFWYCYCQNKNFYNASLISFRSLSPIDFQNLVKINTFYLYLYCILSIFVFYIDIIIFTFK